MSKGNGFAVDFLEQVFQELDLPFEANSDLYVSLHTASPGVAGAQNTSEMTYTGYARVAVARTAGGWVLVGQAMKNTAAVVFPTNTGAAQTATHVGIGTAAAGAGSLIYFSGLAVSTSITTGTAPVFQPQALSTSEV